MVAGRSGTPVTARLGAVTALQFRMLLTHVCYGNAASSAEMDRHGSEALDQEQV